MKTFAAAPPSRRRLTIDRLELSLPAGALGRAGMSRESVSTFARAVAAELGKGMAKQSGGSVQNSSQTRSQIPRRIEVVLPHGPVSAAVVARAIEKKMKNARAARPSAGPVQGGGRG
jgi:hypothetical protein